MRLHAIYSRPGQPTCPRCDRSLLTFRRENGMGDVYHCGGCGLRSWHIQGRHFHGLWAQWGGSDHVQPCPASYPQPQLTCEGGVVGAGRRLVSILRAPRPCEIHGRRGQPYGSESCPSCRAVILHDLGMAVEQGLLHRFNEAWAVEAAAEVRRMFGLVD